MKTLDRKVVRDLWHFRGQCLAVALVVACGIASFLLVRTAYRSILLTRDDYYARCRFADVFVTLKRAPNAIRGQIESIPGVSAVETRVVADVTLDVPNLREPATGRIVSLPEGGPPVLNRLVLRAGRLPEPDRRGEVVASEAFSVANRLSVGDRLGAVLNGRWETLRIVGIAISPEYVYEIRGAGTILPDNRRFGVLWMSRSEAGPAFDMEGGFNDVALELGPGARPADVVDSLDRLLEPFGSLGAYGREDQVSNSFLDNELLELRTEGWVVPGIFFGVAVFLLHIVVIRLVNTQRDQIAVLKALGYGNVTIAVHFLKFVLGIVLIGSAAGTAVGLRLGSSLTRLYADYFRFPVLRYESGAGILGVALLVSLGTAALGALGAVRRVSSLSPAEAMRPEAPAKFRRGSLDRARFLRPETRMIVRNVVRRPARFAFGVFGVALAVMILVLGRYFLDTVDEILDVQFGSVERQDATVAFTNPRSSRAAFELARLPGVLASEPYRVVPVRIRAGHRSKRTVIFGFDPGAELRRVVDRRRRPVELPPDGIVLSARLAQVLDLRPGESARVEVLEGERARRLVDVVAISDELIGTSAYMRRESLARLLHEGDALSGGYLKVDPAASDRLDERLKKLPAIGGVSLQRVMMRSFQDTIARLLGAFTAVLIGLASVIALAIVYNGARIALSERGRELASLRVLGFTRREVSAILLGEQALTVALAIPTGWGLGYGACALMSSLYDTDLMRMPLVAVPRSYLFAALVVVASSALSGLFVARRIGRLDLVEVLKTRE